MNDSEHAAYSTEHIPTPSSHARRIDLFRALPPKEPDLEQEVADTAQLAQRRRSEARRDAILTVAAAIQRRGESPLTAWTTKDADMAYTIADQLIELERKPD